MCMLGWREGKGNTMCGLLGRVDRGLVRKWRVCADEEKRVRVERVAVLENMVQL